MNNMEYEIRLELTGAGCDEKQTDAICIVIDIPLENIDKGISKEMIAIFAASFFTTFTFVYAMLNL